VTSTTHPDFDEELNSLYAEVQIPVSNRKLPFSEALRLVDPDEYQEQFDSWLENRRRQVLSGGIERKGIVTNNEMHFRTLCRLARRRRLVPFIGAGVSASCGFPTWRDFLKRLTGGAVPVPSAGRLLKDGKMENATEEIINAIGENGFREAFRGTFLRSFDRGGAEFVADLLLFTTGPMITTNFDKVIEEFVSPDHIFLGSASRGFMSMLRCGERVLLKLHGDLYQSESRVLTSSEYDSAYGCGDQVDDARELTRTLKQVYLRETLFFIGCSLESDRAMRLFAQIASNEGRDEGVSHYALLELPKSASALPGRSRFLEDRGIFPIWYAHGEHSYVGEIIGEIARSVQDSA